MAKTFYYSVLATAAAFMFLHCAAAHTVHVVGDSTNWSVPSNTDFYANWASSRTFLPNDVLSFVFTTDQHDVVEVPQASYQDCSEASKIGNIIRTGPYNHTLNETGDRYFICSIGSHCSRGQKLTVRVVSSSSTAPTNGPSPSNTQPPPPPGSAAPPALVAGSFFITLSFILGKLVL